MKRLTKFFCAIIALCIISVFSAKADTIIINKTDPQTTAKDSITIGIPESPGIIPFECYEDNGKVTVYTNATDIAKITVEDVAGSVVYEYTGSLFPYYSFYVPQDQTLTILLQIWGYTYEGTIY